MLPAPCYILHAAGNVLPVEMLHATCWCGVGCLVAYVLLSGFRNELGYAAICVGGGDVALKGSTGELAAAR